MGKDGLRRTDAKINDTISPSIQKVESGLRRLDAKVDSAVKPFVQHVLVDQLDMKIQIENLTAKMEKSVSSENSIAPLLQRMAVDQIDMREKLEDVTYVGEQASDLHDNKTSSEKLDALSRDFSQLAIQQQDMWAKLNTFVGHDRDAQDLREQISNLEQELEFIARDNGHASLHDLNVLQEKVCQVFDDRDT